MKICTKCNEEKKLMEFSINKKCKDGYSTFCKLFIRKYNKEYYISNKIDIKRRKNIEKGGTYILVKAKYFLNFFILHYISSR